MKSLFTESMDVELMKIVFSHEDEKKEKVDRANNHLRTDDMGE